MARRKALFYEYAAIERKQSIDFRDRFSYLLIAIPRPKAEEDNDL